MSSNPKEFKTFNIKKDEKLQAKKRKLETLLNRISRVEENPLVKKKGGRSIIKKCKTLKEELMKYQKMDNVEPSLNLTDDGRSALVNLASNKKVVTCTSPLFIEDVYHLLLKSVLGRSSEFPIRFTKLKHPHCINKTVLIEIEGLSQYDVFDISSEFNLNCGMFPQVFEVVSSNTPFATEISTLHLASDFYNQAKEYYSSLFPMKNVINQPPILKLGKHNISKLHLLLSPIELAMEHYPLPKSVFEQSSYIDYCFTKESYIPVSADSPLFALDCEMCQSVTGNREVIRIAIVNENLETVYHTLVKPKHYVTNYMTKYSGVTAKMLENVKTTLEDVHAEIQRILPNDAILCGQSLNCDLHALKMIHPYIIDTSVIYNECGVRKEKKSLKELAKIHLKEVIQDNKMGHNPVEDSVASMKLVQLKLQNYIKYGDVLCQDEDTNNNDDQDQSAAVPANVSKFTEYVDLKSGSRNVGFFNRLAKSAKTVCLIGNEESLSNYYTEMLADNIFKITESGVKNIIETSMSNLKRNDLIISHLVLDAESSSITEVNDGLKQAYDSFPNNTLFIVFISGLDKLKDKNFKHSACMTVLKK